MILQNISKAIREQNYYAVALEFVIVIAGVVIGFQINAWNEARQNATLGEVYTARLMNDLETELRRSESMLRYFRRVDQFADRTIVSFEQPGGASDETFIVAAYNATQWIRRPQRRVTFDELVATGSLRLIADRNLRELAAQLYSADVRGNLSNFVYHSNYRNNLRSIMPHGVQESIRTECGDLFNEYGVAFDIEENCTLELSEQRIFEAAEILRENALLVADLRIFVSQLDSHIYDLEQQIRLLERVLVSQSTE